MHVGQMWFGDVSSSQLLYGMALVESSVGLNSQGTTVAFGLSQALRGGCGRGLQQILQLGFSMLHPFVLPQPLFRSICIVTLVTGKRGNLRGLPLLDE